MVLLARVVVKGAFFFTLLASFCNDQGRGKGLPERPLRSDFELVVGLQFVEGSSFFRFDD